ncbi:ABC transporter permease [Sphingomonas changnyeongensis]|uniref:ABC transporter permease n=1 Tax=Sphingomonas changnyeongensis TaxID=2698679 RepID=A0A7Z2S8M3_9SPHN|nr:ABC transporter permease [Sphingomonas changnyeongensis]QHL91576.1 ABC transporter permease [Sphingomonas changnyeongensis]
MRDLFQPAWAIARRDFAATVLTPTFLLFLLAPLLMFGVGAIGGVGAAQVARDAGAEAGPVALAAGAEAAALRRADKVLRAVLPRRAEAMRLTVTAPAADPAAQARALVLGAGPRVPAVLYGPPGARRVLAAEGASSGFAGDYLVALDAAAAAPGAPARVDTVARPRADRTRESGRSLGFGVVFTMFFLTLLLAGQAVGTLSEERANKAIEILAAAAPLEAVFLGKLLGMLGVAFLFIGFWGALLAQGAALLPADLAAPLRDVIVRPGFILLFIAYFMLAFLLLGAVFLGVGAQAGTMREIQMLSLPITLFQVAMFALAGAAANAPDAPVGVFAAIFPFSSPFAMAARAAMGVPMWQHAAALAWQLLWLAGTILLAARLFRIGVLKSGGLRLFARRSG